MKSRPAKILRCMLPLLAAISFNSSAQVFFQDDFDGGKRQPEIATDGSRWGDWTSTVGMEQYANGEWAMAFNFHQEEGGDSWSEQNLYFNNKNEVWVSYDIYLPANYHHRQGNNKFFCIYNNNHRPGFYVNFSTEAASDGGSYIDIRYYRNGSEQDNSKFRPAGGWPRIWDPSKDNGKWHKIVMHFKTSTNNNTPDGVAQIWKNGELLLNITNLDAYASSNNLNYMDEAYFIGWSNSGYAQKTQILVDNFTMSNSPIDVNGDPIVVALPNPPTGITASYQ